MMTDSSIGRDLSILFVGTQMAIGGAQKLLLDQARWFHSRGHRVTAAFFYDKQGLQHTWERGLGFPLLALSGIGARSNPLTRAWGLLRGLVRLWDLLRRGGFDVVETFTYDSNLLALPLAWMARIPVRVATHHGIIEGFPFWIERVHAALVNAGIASVLVNVSRKVLDQAAKAGTRSDRMLVIQNGIPPVDYGNENAAGFRAQLGMAEGDALLLSVGRLVYQKGHEYLIDAMPGILRRFPGAKTIVCGDGPLRAQLEAQIARMNLGESVRLLGNRNDMRPFLHGADVFVLPSRWEGLPVALLEAMGAGLPVVATRVEGVEEVVEHAGQGLLVPPEDAPALADALVQLISDSALRLRMGSAARSRIRESFTIDTMCDKYLQLMRDLMARRTGETG
jgi:glycosyltransferase involved in cell wall biosynthesis